MKRILITASVILFTVLSDGVAQTSAGQTPLPSVRLPRELARVLIDYQHAWIGHDAGALALLFAEDGFVLSNGRLPVRGRDAIRTAYAGAGGPLHLRALDYATEGSVGYIIGGYAINDEADAGKFILALRKNSEGRWMITADIDNSNRRSLAKTVPPPALTRTPPP